MVACLITKTRITAIDYQALPVKRLLASEARKTTAGAISCGSPIRFMGENVIQSSYQWLLVPPFDIVGALHDPFSASLPQQSLGGFVLCAKGIGRLISSRFHFGDIRRECF